MILFSGGSLYLSYYWECSWHQITLVTYSSLSSKNLSTTPLHNPYEISWENGAAHAFPYPAFMLFFMTVPRLLTMPFSANDWYLPFKFLLYHLPIFIADFAILVVFYIGFTVAVDVLSY